MKNILMIAFITGLVISCSEKPLAPETAMHHYLQTKDNAFRWEIQEQSEMEGISFTRIIFTSQVWRGIEWVHELTLIIPDRVEYDDALLFITGGSVKNGKPNTHQFTEELTTALSSVARENNTVISILWQVPNQPLFDDLTEDALISFTLHNYLDDHDFSWPLLFPMTKSAVRAMDVVQQFSSRHMDKKIDEFIVSGASKRGWTTWLAGANDKRVKAVCPMVIDVLNMPVNIDYQKTVWGDYSEEIVDYVRLGIAQQMGTPGGGDLVRMVDPYSYRDNLKMPKMIFMGTNDPYWPVDAVKNYIDSIPGMNYLCYTPNAGHDLGGGEKAFAALSGFLNMTVTGSGYPEFDYTIADNDSIITLNVKSENFTGASIWSADSEDQDFRDEHWSDSTPGILPSGEVRAEIEKPSSGYKAFFIDLQFKSPTGVSFTKSTRMFVTDKNKVLLN